MRRRALAGLVAILVAAGLAGCGNGDDGGDPTDAAGRPLLPLASGGGATSMAAEVKSAAGGAGADAMLAPERPVEYRVAGDAKAPAKTAPAYRIVPSGDLEPAEVAKALGLTEADGEVEIERGLGWFYGREPDETVSSAVAEPCEAPESGTCPEPEMAPPPEGLPTAEEAVARFRKMLEALGFDVPAGSVRSVEGNPYSRDASFFPKVDGYEIDGLESSISFGEHGRVEYSSGFLGRLEKVGDYPLVGLEEAVRRAKDGFGGGLGIMTAGGAAEGVAVDSVARAQGAPTESSGGTESTESTETTETSETTAPPEPEIVEITGAEVVLELVYPACEDGEYLIVPSFRLLPADRVGFTVPAVAEDSLQSEATAADDEAADEPCPEDVGDEPAVDEPAVKPEPAPAPAPADRQGSTEPGQPSDP